MWNGIFMLLIFVFCNINYDLFEFSEEGAMIVDATVGEWLTKAVITADKRKGDK